MTKEERIKEAWVEFWDRLTENQKEYALENNGNVQIGYNIEQTLLYRDIIKTKLFLTQPIFPKSLQGIGNNNGWIKIECEDDLPKEVINCWFATDNGIYLGYYTTRGYFVNEGEDIELKFITHYQLIEEPKPPIY